MTQPGVGQIRKGADEQVEESSRKIKRKKIKKKDPPGGTGLWNCGHLGSRCAGLRASAGTSTRRHGCRDQLVGWGDAGMLKAVKGRKLTTGQN
jgi:hypothetical protein